MFSNTGKELPSNAGNLQEIVFEVHLKPPVVSRMISLRSEYNVKPAILEKMLKISLGHQATVPSARLHLSRYDDTKVKTLALILF